MKKIKWHHKVNTWNKVIMYLSPLAGGEVLALFANFPLPTWVHGVVGVSAALVLYLKMFVTNADKNNDGIIDHFQE